MITRGTDQQTMDAAHASLELSTLEPPWRGRQERERRATARALASERRRIAADVHDLIMQDLSYALATARELADDTTAAPLASTVVAAGERALAGARHILGALAAGEREAAIEAVEESMHVAARHLPLSFDVGGVPVGVQPDQPTLYALVHIAREAVANAVKHARPVRIEAALDYTGEWRLWVRDDGRGFDAGGEGTGFGLLSMRRHAHALGGSLNVSSAIGTGTTVEAILP